MVETEVVGMSVEAKLILKVVDSAGKRLNFPRGKNSGNNFPQTMRESKFVAFRDKSA